jgi:uracil-DNA glycosylase
MGLLPGQFYDPAHVALVPMGFCYPGTGPSGDLPPRRECAPAWRTLLLGELRDLELTLVIGRYAQEYHLRDIGSSVTETVKMWRQSWPDVIPLPHPSPRNNIWLKRNPWFADELVPALQQRVREVLASTPRDAAPLPERP